MAQAHARRGHARPLKPDQRVIDTRPMHIPPQDRARTVHFGNQIIARIQKLRGDAIDNRLTQPPGRVIAETRRHRPGDADQVVFSVIAILPRAIIGQITAQVITTLQGGNARIAV